MIVFQQVYTDLPTTAETAGNWVFYLLSQLPRIDDWQLELNVGS